VLPDGQEPGVVVIGPGVLGDQAGDVVEVE
jgi:hypothetical protein